MLSKLFQKNSMQPVDGSNSYKKLYELMIKPFTAQCLKSLDHDYELMLSVVLDDDGYVLDIKA